MVATPTTTTLTVAGCKTHLRRAGRGRPVLWLHGGGGVTAWAPFMDRLSDSYELIVPDHPGFGRSDMPAWLDDIEDCAFFYLDLIEALGLERLHLAGNAIGAWMAAELAIRDTSRLATLTLVGAAGIRVKGVRKADPFMMSEEEHVRALFHNPSFAEARLKAKRSEEEEDIALRNEFTFARLAWEPRFFSPHLEKWIHRIKLPTLIVWGEGDRMFSVPHAAAWHRLIAGSRLEIYAQCGHLPHIEKADQFVATFTRFAEEKRS
ncbi:MAG: alpha/beta fold hydrolase [Alphaproteobacteria bacterium]|nr:alpha/beta fold hydrolase [Alphaproteobacteria bacterium]